MCNVVLLMLYPCSSSEEISGPRLPVAVCIAAIVVIGQLSWNWTINFFLSFLNPSLFPNKLSILKEFMFILQILKVKISLSGVEQRNNICQC